MNDFARIIAADKRGISKINAFPAFSRLSQSELIQLKSLENKGFCISGSERSGKSRIAENLLDCLRSDDEAAVYGAAMYNDGSAEIKNRVEQHVAARKNKNYHLFELFPAEEAGRYFSRGKARLNAEGKVILRLALADEAKRIDNCESKPFFLLECLGNLISNILYPPDMQEEFSQKDFQPDYAGALKTAEMILDLLQEYYRPVVVMNNVFEDLPNPAVEDWLNTTAACRDYLLDAGWRYYEVISGYAFEIERY